MARIPNIATPSVAPGLPRKPPATSTTQGTVNTMKDTAQMGEYGAKHRALKVCTTSERAGDFK
jgi:hypothetical protein